MNLLILIPVVLVALVALVWLFGRKGRPGSGLGDRRDSTERPELRGPEQRRLQQIEEETRPPPRPN